MTETTFVKVIDGVVVNRAVFDGIVPEDWPEEERASWHEAEVAQIGWTFDGSEFVDPNAPQPMSLAALKEQLRRSIDSAAEAQRLKFITPGEGQALVYEAKRTEASRWHNAGEPVEPNADAYPWAADRAAATGQPLAAVLAEWLQRAGAWAAIGIAIERVREGAKAAIDAAEDEASVRAVVEAIEWPSI